jgi:hypothetical protein
MQLLYAAIAGFALGAMMAAICAATATQRVVCMLVAGIILAVDSFVAFENR